MVSYSLMFDVQVHLLLLSFSDLRCVGCLFLYLVYSLAFSWSTLALLVCADLGILHLLGGKQTMLCRDFSKSGPILGSIKTAFSKLK